MIRAMTMAMLWSGLPAVAVHADVVVPNSAASLEGDFNYSLTTAAATGRTFQWTIAAPQLIGLSGQSIVGLQWRLDGGYLATWPAANVSYAAWDVYIGPGVAPSTMSNTFAENFSAPPTQVRSGPLTIPSGLYSSGASPNAWGPALSFVTPYLYTGGDLTVELRFSQQIGSSISSPLDAYAATNGPANGWGVDYAARWTGSALGTTGSSANVLVTRFIVPAPSSISLLAFAAAVGPRRRR